MVRIIGYKQRQKEDGELFYALELQGGVELIKSKTTGNFYATAKKASLPSTFEKETCEALIGTDLPGNIIKEECEPYDYTIKETGEEITLFHRWVYVSENNKETETKDADLLNQKLKPDVETFSKNGSLQHA